jgi:hypothetical protein
MFESIENVEREHIYVAEAKVLSAELRTPLKRSIQPLAAIELSEKGGYEAREERNFRIEEVVSFRSGYTQVAGNKATLPCDGWATLATSVVEGLNILDVVTADRVVAQVRTVHPLVGYVPTVTFLGTRFENLRIAGHPVKLDLDLDIVGDKPANDAPYIQDADFLSRVARQYECLGKDANLPVEIAERYNQLPLSSENGETVECSLVNQAEGSYPGRSAGHVIRIPNFGVVTLANLRLEQSDFQAETKVPKKTLFHLTMIDVQLNCTGDGRIPVSICILNGHGRP